MRQTPEIPNSVLNDIGEFTNGFLLVALTEDGTIDVYDNLNNQIQSLAVDKYLEQYLRNKDEMALSDFMEAHMGDGSADRADEMGKDEST